MQFYVGAWRGRCIKSLDGLFDSRDVFGKVTHRDRLKLLVGGNRSPSDSAEEWPQHRNKVVFIAVIYRKDFALKYFLGDQVPLRLGLGGWSRLLCERHSVNN